MTETVTIFRNARVLDGRENGALEDQDVVVEGNLIKDVTAERVSASGATVIDLAGKTLMPGLIDCHVHVIAALANLTANAELPNTLVSLRSAKIMHAMLMRGFTTVRDLGGADIGLKMAIEEGTIVGPRLIICGKALSQTGGHTDYRGRFHHRDVEYYADKVGSLGRVVDGVDAVRRVAREEIKGGAEFIKLMANGGVSSPTDPIAFLGFSRDEMKAAVEEAENAQMYVAAHLYTDESIRRHWMRREIHRTRQPDQARHRALPQGMRSLRRANQHHVRYACQSRRQAGSSAGVRCQDRGRARRPDLPHLKRLPMPAY